MNAEVTTKQMDVVRLRRAFGIMLASVVLCWLILWMDWALDLGLIRLGVFPRQWHGLIGILFAPLIHGSVGHVFANTLPLLVLGTLLLYGYPRSSGWVIPLIYFGSGMGVWWFARESYHIGASGLTFGFMFFLFAIGALRWDPRAIAVSCIAFFMYGGMVWGILPSEPNISFESHFFGAVIGVVCAWVFRNRDPAPAGKHYDWEDESEEDSELPWEQEQDSNQLH